MNFKKYRPYETINKTDRKWPNNKLTKAPIWCSVDLRDGNQSLEVPMNLNQKIEFFKFLVEVGFKEIEVGFPAASDTDFDFTRTLIEQNLIPDDVVIQVLTQSREHIIARTYEALKGVKKAVVHLYNSTSTLQREVVFGNSKEETIDLAVFGAKKILELAKENGRERFLFEYSPESFTGTEMDFASIICNKVLDELEPSKDFPVIINLPSTVEMSTPNIYADQIEYMIENMKYREDVRVSLHTHNDRGTGVAATELGLLAGADRVEGTLFGNGERTGNVDIITVALNLFTHGIDPKLDFSNIEKAVSIYENVTKLPVHQRHPYAGDLVFTAFSGSHQDAIKKGMATIEEKNIWAVPYLPIDPVDLGKNYEPIIRINSQSGKGGVAYILEQNYGFIIPKPMQVDFSKITKKVSDEMDKELKITEIYDLFMEAYVDIEKPLFLIRYDEKTDGYSEITIKFSINGEQKCFEESGNGIIEAFCKGLQNSLGIKFDVVNYSQHSMEHSSKSRAITYVEISTPNGDVFFGAGISASITRSSLRAVVSCVNKML